MIRRYLWLYLCSCLRSLCWPATLSLARNQGGFQDCPSGGLKCGATLFFVHAPFRCNTVETRHSSLETIELF